MIRKFAQSFATLLVILLPPAILSRAGYSAPPIISSAMSGMIGVGDDIADSLSASAEFISESTAVAARQMVNANAHAERSLELLYAYLIPESPSEKLADRLTDEMLAFKYAGVAIASQITNRASMGAVAVVESSEVINASAGAIADQIGGALTDAASAMRCFFTGWIPGSVCGGTPSGATGGGTILATATPTPQILTVSSFTRSQLLTAIQDVFRQGLPPDILAQLKGPKGDPGTAGVQGPSGYSIGAVYPTAGNQNAGTIGGVTYFGAKNFTTETLTATGASTLSSLNVSGATTMSSLTVSGTTTLADFTVSSLDVTGNSSVSGTFEAGTLKGDGQQLTLARVAGSTYATVQHLQTVYHSTGWTSGGAITNDGGGSVTVATGTGLIRNANSPLATLMYFDWPASGSFALTDNAINYIYIDYNDGSPKVSLLSAEDTSNYQTRFLLAKIVRTGTTLHFNEMVKPTVGDHAGLMIREMQQTMPYSNASGGDVIAASNPLAFDIMDGSWWHGLNKFTTPAFDGDTGTFSYFYRDGAGGWTEVAGSTQINVTQYDDADGTPGTLTDNQYGVHWIYMETNGDISVVYGSKSYTLNEAQNEGEPASLPVQVDGASFIVGKIIVRKSAATLTRIDSVAMIQTRFQDGAIADHNSLVTLQGGTADEYYHLTVAQRDRWASGSASLALMADCSNATASKLLYNSTTGVFSCGVDQNTGGGGGGGSLQVREYRTGGFNSFPASLSFDAGKFNLTASGSSDVGISLDWGAGGPASRSIAQTISGNWVFIGADLGLLVTTNASISGNFEITGSLQAGRTVLSGNASVSAILEATSLRAASLGSDANLTVSPATGLTLAPVSGLTLITGRASVSANVEVGGYASASQLFGSGLSACPSSSMLDYDSSTGHFSCRSNATLTDVPFWIREIGTAYFNAASLSFSGSGFTVGNVGSDARVSLDYTNGPASRSIAQTISGAWNFTGGASVSTNPFEVGANAFYVHPTTSRIGINTQNLSETLELTGNASVSGNLYALGDVGIGTTSPTSRFSVVGDTSGIVTNALLITNASGSTLFAVRNDGAVSIGTTDPGQSALRIRPITVPGTATLSTSGSSTTVTTTGGAFTDVTPFTVLTANSISRTVLTKTDNNTVVVDSAVDWSAGYAFTYQNSANVSVDSPDDVVSRVLTFTRGNTTDWTLLARREEAGQNFYIRNGVTGKDTLTVTEKGAMALNLPSTLASATPNIPGTFSVYPQPFDKAFASVSGTFYDETTNAANSEDTPTPFTVTPNTDFLYLGALRKFGNVFLERVTGPTAGVLKAEYWNGAAWVTIGGAMGFADATNGFTKSGAVSWRQTALTGWSTRSVNSSASLYYVRLSFTTYVGGILRINMLVPNTANRLDIFKAPGDTHPAFAVSGLGRVGLGDRVRDGRIIDLGSDLTENPALSVIDSHGMARIWSYSASRSAGIQLIAGIGSVSDNLQWDIHLASKSGLYSTEGLIFGHRNGSVGQYDALTLNPTNLAGTSAVGATFQSVFGAMNGNDLMRGLFLNYTNGSHTGTGNEVRALDIAGITPSANASESAIVVGPGWDYAFIASQGNVGIGTETPNYRLEVGGTASVSQLFGAGLTLCNTGSDKLQYNTTTGLFSCASEQNAKMEEGGVTISATQRGLDMSASGFNLTASGSTEVLIALDYLNGPASRSIAQSITGHWTFSAGVSVSAPLDVIGNLTADGYFGASLTTCNGPTQKLTWASGLFGCGVDQNTGGGGATGSIQIREFGQSFDSTPATMSFNPGSFNLVASGGADVSIKLDWVNGPASRSIAQTITGAWDFTGGLTASQLAATSASISTNLEVMGYASTSKMFGAGLTNCTSLFNVIRWDATTGTFSCHVEGGGTRSESSETTIIANNNAFNFSATKFSLTASGSTETNIDLNLGSVWDFVGGVSVSNNALEVGSHVLYADPTAARVGINTQNLTEALEVVGNASVSGNVYAGNIGIGTTAVTSGFRLDVNGAGRFGDGTHTSQTLLQFNVGTHTYTMLYTPAQFGNAGYDGLVLRPVNTEQNLFTVYGSQSVQIISNAQGAGFDSQFIAMNNPNMANLTTAAQGLFTNKATTHDIAIQYRYGTGTPIDAILLDVDPTANALNSIIINNDSGTVPFQVKGLSDSNLIYTNGISKVGIGTNAPLTKLEVQGTASASHLLTTGGLQVAGGASVSYSRFGTNATTHSLSTTSDLLINGSLEVDGRVFFDSGASVSANFEVGGTASVSGTLFANGALTVVGQLSFANASSSGALELTAASSKLGINAGSFINTTFEVGGTASISGQVSLGGNASSSGAAEFQQYASASKLFGAGLKDCDNVNEKLLWTASGSAAGKFSCGYDQHMDGMQVFTGNGTWTRPASVSQVYVEVWGGGGGGAAGTANLGGGGGGGGGYSAGIASVSGDVAVTVGGAAGNSSFAGGATFNGLGGSNASTGTGGAGGGANGGQINISGATGGNGENSDGGGGGGGGGPGANGSNPSSPGAPGTIPGGGGGGGAENAGTAGAGAVGRVIVWAIAGTSRSDIAEWYETDGTVGPGDIVTMSSESFTYTADTGTHTIAVLTKAKSGDDVFGVVSTYPEIYMGNDILLRAQHPQAIALAGRVPVAVSTANGGIRKGDLLKVSSVPGVAVRMDKAGEIIGSAMEDYSGFADTVGHILVFVHTGYSTGARLKSVMAQRGIDLDAVPHDVDIGTVILGQMIQDKQNIQQEIDMSEIFSDRIVAGLEIITPRAVTDALVVNTIEPVDKDIRVSLGGGGVFTVTGDAVFSGALTANSLTVAQLPQLAGLEVQMNALASQSAMLRQFVIDGDALLTDADVQLTQSLASQSVHIDALAVRLGAAEVSLAALASQSQGLTFDTPVLFGGGLRVDSIMSISDMLTFGSDTYFFGRPYFNNDTAGFAVIHAGVREVYVPFSAPYLEAPVVHTSLLTTASQSVDDLLTDHVRFAIASVSGDGFTIRLAKNATADTRLSWIAIAVHDARTVFSLLPPEPMATPAPVVVEMPPAVTGTPEVLASPSASVLELPTPSETPIETPTETPTPFSTSEAVGTPTPGGVEADTPAPVVTEAPPMVEPTPPLE